MIHNRLMNLGNLVEIAVHLIGEIICLDHQDDFPMVHALVYMIIHRIRPILNHDINYQAVKIHQPTIL